MQVCLRNGQGHRALGRWRDGGSRVQKGGESTTHHRQTHQMFLSGKQNRCFALGPHRLGNATEPFLKR